MFINLKALDPHEAKAERDKLVRHYIEIDKNELSFFEQLELIWAQYQMDPGHYEIEKDGPISEAWYAAHKYWGEQEALAVPDYAEEMADISRENWL